MRPDLFVGITSWNSELFLDSCLSALAKTTAGLKTEIMVLDNGSEDSSEKITRSHGVQFVRHPCPQSDALNRLLDKSNAHYTLLLHADTIMLSERWFELCRAKLDNKVILVSPEDIGCGPFTRSFGIGQPESSFLFFDTEAAKDARTWRITRRRFRIPLKIQRMLDFYGPHITHRLTGQLALSNKSWYPMRVMHSRVLTTPVYYPEHITNHWTELLGRLEYGLGNFYEIGGVITHYHNWYDRLEARTDIKNGRSTGKNNDGFPINFVREYSLKFIDDFRHDRVSLPEPGDQIEHCLNRNLDHQYD